MPLSLFSTISHLHPHFSSNPRTPSSLLFTHAALHRCLLRQQWFPFFPFPRIRSGFPSLSLLLRRRRWLRNSRPVAFSWDRTKATSSPGRNLLPGPQVAKGMALSGVHTDRGELRIHESLDELGIDLADYISELSEASVKERGVFAIALSSGSLIGLMRKLCEAPYIKTVDWSKWYVFWVDERVVAKNHAESNYKMARDLLLTKVPIVHSHVHSINDFVSAEEASDEYEFAIVVIGDSKAEAVHLVIDDVGPDCPSVPARMIQPTEGKLVWFLDKPSASRLDGSKFSKQGPA